ncbi:MAG: NAD(P)/FAD-dependent oxidoreductase, partial [Bacilli bacterium]|nr:NAD(P)/FAD-dependent oxidoreductase [Bacilli bacterium]
IIGAGPAGMMAAISSKIHNPQFEVLLIERNNQLAKKMRLTGGGRCNVTANVANDIVIENTPKNGKFLFSSLMNFNPKDIQNFFISEGCPLKIEDHDRVFPKSDKSTSIINTLENKLKSLNVQIKFETLVEIVDVDKKILKINSQDITYDYLIIATGGKTYPHTGSDGSGYKIAELFGHKITELLPAEVPLVSNDKVIQDKELQGLSFKDIKLNIIQNNKVKKSIIHDLIITHFGLSGPAALRASFYIQNILKKESLAQVSLDFLPNTKTTELENLNESELTKTLLDKGLPKRLLNYIKIKTRTIDESIQLIKNFKLNIYTTKGFSLAFVTNGGIDIKEIDPKTMKSRLNNSLSFCGEIIDINSFTGGFNITSALSTGYTAGKYINS